MGLWPARVRSGFMPRTVYNSKCNGADRWDSGNFAVVGHGRALGRADGAFCGWVRISDLQFLEQVFVMSLVNN